MVETSMESIIKDLTTNQEIMKWNHNYDENFPRIIECNRISLLMMPGKAAECGFPILPTHDTKSPTDNAKKRYEISHRIMEAMNKNINYITYTSMTLEILHELQMKFIVTRDSDYNYTISWYPSK